MWSVLLCSGDEELTLRVWVHGLLVTSRQAGIMMLNETGSCLTTLFWLISVQYWRYVNTGATLLSCTKTPSNVFILSLFTSHAAMQCIVITPVSLSVCMSVCLFLSVCLSVCLSVFVCYRDNLKHDALILDKQGLLVHGVTSSGTEVKMPHEKLKLWKVRSSEMELVGLRWIMTMRLTGTAAGESRDVLGSCAVMVGVRRQVWRWCYQVMSWNGVKWWRGL